MALFILHICCLFLQNEFIKVKFLGFKRIQNSKNVKFNPKLP